MCVRHVNIEVTRVIIHKTVQILVNGFILVFLNNPGTAIGKTAGSSHQDVQTFSTYKKTGYYNKNCSLATYRGQVLGS